MSTPIHIVYLSHDGLTDSLGQSQILPYITRLSKKRYNFTIISFEKRQKFQKLQQEINKQCIHYSIKWIPLRYHKYPPVLSTLFDLWKLQQSVKKEHETCPFQIIHCRSYITSLIGLSAKRRWKVKFVFDMRGFWADERVEGGLWNLKNPVFQLIYNFFKNKERDFLREADHIVSLTSRAKEEIESRNLRNSPISVIPTCVDLELFDPAKIEPADQQRLREKLGINNKEFVLLYLGAWGTWYLTTEMLEFFRRTKIQKPNAKFLIVSGDEVKLNRPDLNDNIILTKAPRDLVPLYISLANMAVCFIRPTFSKIASSATKVGEIMAMKVPLIVNSGWGDIADQSLYGGCTVISDVSTDYDFSNLNSLFDNAKSRPREFPSQLSVEAGVEKYSLIFSSLTSMSEG